MVLFTKTVIPLCHSFVMMDFLLLHMTELQVVLLLTLSLEKHRVYFVFDNLKRDNLKTYSSLYNEMEDKVHSK